MIISDLNYLEAVTESVIGGNNVDFSKKLSSVVDTKLVFNSASKVDDVFNKKANIAVNSNVKGNSSDFTFDNEALGPNSSTEGTFNQEVIAGVGSSQNGSFVAAANA